MVWACLTGSQAVDSDAEMSVLARLRALGTRPRDRLRRELRGTYLETLRVARQLRAHADHVPYPALTDDLHRLADQADRHAAALAEELRAVAGDTDRHAGTALHGGHNHWARLAADLGDLEALHRRYTELALRWDVEFPAAAVTLTELQRGTARMKVAVRALIARSDPHADN
jgi:hypothetical protein